MFFAANKSVVSSSIGSEFTFFQTLEDHVTLPVLFIPETHLSSLQRVVSSLPAHPHYFQLRRLSPFHSSSISLRPHFTPCRHERQGGKKGECKKKQWESM